MDISHLLTAIAARIDAEKATIGLEGVSYPALNSVPANPWAMVRQSTVIPTTIEKARLSRQVVLPNIDIVLLVASSEKRPGDAARIDNLINPVLDLFDFSAAGGAAAAFLTGLPAGSHVDRVWDTATVRRTSLIWGEAGYCYAAILTMNAKFQRSPG